MRKEEARKIFDKISDKFEEIDRHEYNCMSEVEKLRMCCSDGILYFKPKLKFPVVFKICGRIMEINQDGSIFIKNKCTNDNIFFFESLPTLYEAVELSKKLRGIK